MMKHQQSCCSHKKPCCHCGDERVRNKLQVFFCIVHTGSSRKNATLLHEHNFFNMISI